MVSPTPAQSRYLALQRGMMLHYGINTYYDVEWSDGTLDPKAFHPTDLDPDSWCRSAARAGLRLVVLTTKHHDGFCLWPSAWTDYGVASSPCRRDIVAEWAAACRRHGLRMGLYYSLWDRRHDTGDDAAYAAFMEGQLIELLERCPDPVLLWLDGAWFKMKDRTPTLQEMEDIERLFPAWDVDGFRQAWQSTGRRRWHMDRLYATVKALAPDCLVMNNTTTAFPGIPLFPVDARCGEKAAGLGGDQKEWEDGGLPRYLPLQIEMTLSRQGPPGPFASGAWFWHPGDHSCATLEEVRQWQQKARDLQAVLLINSGIMASGRLRPEDEALHQAMEGLEG